MRGREGKEGSTVGEMERGGGRDAAFLVMAKTEAAGADRGMEGNR